MWTIGRTMPARWNITVLAKISRVTIVRQDHHTIPVLPVSWGDKEAREASQKVFHLRRVYLWTDTSSTSTITVIATTGYNLVEEPVFSSNIDIIIGHTPCESWQRTSTSWIIISWWSPCMGWWGERKSVRQLFVSVCRTCDLYSNLTPKSPHHYRKQHVRFSCYSYPPEI